jgi:hypothetical protein
MPQHLDQITAPSPKDEDLASMGVHFQMLLHGERQAIEALAHVSVAGG